MNMVAIAIRVASDAVVEQYSVPMVGRLSCSQKGGEYAILEVPQDFAESVYEAIHEPPMEKPPNYAPHISVMTDEELAEIGDVEEDGDDFLFTVEGIDSVDPEGWDEMEKVWFVRCKSPELEALREKYGLTPLMHGDHQFHISIAVKPNDSSGAKVVDASVQDVLKRIDRRFSDKSLAKILKRKVERFRYTKDPKHDLTLKQSDLLYKDVHHDDVMSMPGKSQVKVRWTGHGKYRSELRDVSPRAVNDAVRDAMSEIYPKKRGKGKHDIDKSGVGSIVIDYNTSKQPLDAKVVTVWASMARRIASEMAARFKERC